MAVCTISKTTFTGAQFIAALGGVLTSVGGFDAAAIDNDIALNGDFSQVGIAATLINKWVIDCQVQMDMVEGLCNTLKQGFKFMVLYMYQDLYMTTQRSCGCKCEEHDYATLARLLESACRFFCQISLCLKKHLIAWSKANCVESVQQTYDLSAFSVQQVTDNCVNFWELPYGCDSCGC